ncbi:hypothetical protein EAH80_27140 [Mycobacterium hodleri]|uniref:Uncharacterized protein n=2 Tax=Mycolicibacterium hodleri TaxID=49897 RepID=A0A502DZ35_9MYCO|nr:hypothetical protein EAH80_27140 [Mycolicibacterium hodleri]
MAVGMALVGCEASHANADPVAVALDQVFTLGGGREALIDGEDLRLRFADVPEDSRCPERVECFWTGQARVLIVVEPDGSEPTALEFNTNPAPGQTISTVRVDEYTVEMTSLDPYPQSPEEPIELADYRIGLMVKKD